MTKARLLVVSSDPTVRAALCAAGEQNHWYIEAVADVWNAIDNVQSAAPDLLVLDQPKNEEDGSTVLRVLRRIRPDLRIVLVHHPFDPGNKQVSSCTGTYESPMPSFEDDQLVSVIKRRLCQTTESDGRDVMIGALDPVVGNLVHVHAQSAKRYVAAGRYGNGFDTGLAATKANLPDAVNGARQSADVAVPALPQARGICGYPSLRSFLQSVKQEAEKQAITVALETTRWNRKAAARLLKTSYRSVLYKIDQYRMHCPDSSQSNGFGVSEPEFHHDGHREASGPGLSGTTGKN